jgi:hypothetical protein
MGFSREAEKLRRVWQQLYNPKQFHRLPPRLLQTADQIIPQLVDEIAFQTRRNLAQRALADIIPFNPETEQAIRDGARQLADNKIPLLPPRHLVSAASYALATGKIPPRQLATLVIEHLNQLSPQVIPNLAKAQPLLVA